MAYKPRPMKKRTRIPEHDSKTLEPCSPNCPGCEQERQDLKKLGNPPPPDLLPLKRNTHYKKPHKP